MKKSYLKYSLIFFIIFLTIKELSAQRVPAIYIDSISWITAKTAEAFGYIQDSGWPSTNDVGFCYSTNPNPTINDNTINNNNKPNHLVFENGPPYFGNYRAYLDTLKANTTYYVRAYATNTVGVAYSSQLSFTTLPLVKPIVTTDSINSVSATTANGYINLITYGGDPYVKKGICYDTIPNPTINTTPIPSVKDSIIHYNGNNINGIYQIDFSGLTPNTKYYMRAFASNDSGTVYGAELSITTLLFPKVKTDSIDTISALNAKGYIDIISNGGNPILSAGIYYGLTPYSKDNSISVNNYNNINTGRYQLIISNLIPDTTYYAMSVVTTIAGTIYGNQLTFKTLPLGLPTLKTDSVIVLDAFSANIYGDIIYNGGDPSHAFGGICYSTSPNPTTNDNAVSYNNTYDASYNLGPFQIYESGLTPNTTYFMRVYAINSVGTAYGNTIIFKTLKLTLPKVTTDSINNISTTSATGYLTVTNDGGDPNIVGGICYSTSANPTINDNAISIGYGSGSSQEFLSNLTPNTKYYVRAYATNSAGTSYGNQLIFIANNNSPTVMSITEEILATEINAYPNPTRGIISLQGQLENTQVKICDVLGNSVYQNNGAASNLQIDLSAQPNGVYFMSIQTGEGSVNKKIVVSR